MMSRWIRTVESNGLGVPEGGQSVSNRVAESFASITAESFRDLGKARTRLG